MIDDETIEKVKNNYMRSVRGYIDDIEYTHADPTIQEFMQKELNKPEIQSQLAEIMTNEMLKEFCMKVYGFYVVDNETGKVLMKDILN